MEMFHCIISDKSIVQNRIRRAVRSAAQVVQQQQQQQSSSWTKTLKSASTSVKSKACSESVLLLCWIQKLQNKKNDHPKQNQLEQVFKLSPTCQGLSPASEVVTWPAEQLQSFLGCLGLVFWISKDLDSIWGDILETQFKKLRQNITIVLQKRNWHNVNEDPASGADHTDPGASEGGRKMKIHIRSTKTIEPSDNG